MKFNPKQKVIARFSFAMPDGMIVVMLSGGGNRVAKSGQKDDRPVLVITEDGLAAATGSTSEPFQRELLDQVTNALWNPERKSNEDKLRSAKAAYDALQRIAPRSEVEGMLAAQMIATHNAAMECLRRAMSEGQTFAVRDQNLKHATKLLGLYERQMAALDRHRGKGQQRITVEHVTVEAGGQAIVGNVGVDAATSAAPPIAENLVHQQCSGVPVDKAMAIDKAPVPVRASSRSRPAKAK